MKHFPTRHRRVAHERRPLHRLSIFLGATFATSAHASCNRAQAQRRPQRMAGVIRIARPTLPTASTHRRPPRRTATFIDSYIFDSLLSIDAKGHYVGDLATKYEVSNGGTRLTFTLRKNVVFSNGDPLTAQDVKYHIRSSAESGDSSPPRRRRLLERRTSNQGNQQLDRASSISAAPNRPLLTNLAGAYTGILDKKWFQAHAGS